MLEDYKTTVLARFPELEHASFSLLTQGWDSLAVDVDDRLIFKFPRDTDGAAALRREARLLTLIGQKVTLPVPDLVVFETPLVFSRHTKLKGEYLLMTHYQGLDRLAQQRLAQELALFYAQLHTIEPMLMQQAGALPIEAWPDPSAIMNNIQCHLPKQWLPLAERMLDQWSQLPPDPYGQTYGFFDGHGRNMAFDHSHQRLNGIYDFGDSGFGDLHQEFIYSSFISPALTKHIITEYEQLTGRSIDFERVELLTKVLHLAELGECHPDAEQPGTRFTHSWDWLIGEQSRPNHEKHARWLDIQPLDQ